MSKVIRVGITDDEWRMLEPLLTHHGHLSFILRQAIKQFIREKGEGNGGGSKGRRSSHT